MSICYTTHIVATGEPDWEFVPVSSRQIDGGKWVQTAEPGYVEVHRDCSLAQRLIHALRSLNGSKNAQVR